MPKGKRGNGQGTLFKRDGGQWIASWYDHDGRRRKRSTGTTDKAAAARILAKLTADAALRREGVIDPTAERHATEGRRPLAEHIRDYLAHCRTSEQAPRHVQQKETRLGRFMAMTRATRLADVTPDRLEGFMDLLRAKGLAARTINAHRATLVAFMAWAEHTGRAERNPLTRVGQLDEEAGRRLVRRALTDDELRRLLDVAGDDGHADGAGVRHGGDGPDATEGLPASRYPAGG